MQTYQLAHTQTQIHTHTHTHRRKRTAEAHARARTHSLTHTDVHALRDRQLASKHHGWSFGKSTN